ncbi:MAG: hypothetical protein IT452_14230 [Planctomycetia bacterium]|nr:hypothetical protein [Planctomycetia bacterium]
MTVRVPEVLRNFLEANRARIEAAAERVVGKRVPVKIEAPGAGGGAVTAPSPAPVKKNIELDPAVRRVMEKFDARVTNVEDPQK